MEPVICVAGEASGDRLLAPIVSHLRAQGIEAIGLGGDESAAAGLSLWAHARDLGGHGLVEAMGTAPAVLAAWRRLRAAVPRARALVLVDFPEVNLRLLARARRAGVPAMYLAPPQAWAWRPWRARALRAADWVGCLLAFEAEWYRARGVTARCVGHPLADRPPLPPPDRPGLALFPGSRAAAVAENLPIQLAAAVRLCRQWSELSVHIACAPTIDRGLIERAWRAADLPGCLHADPDAALARSTVALAGAGTATLHATLAGRPVVTMARLHPLTAAVARRLVRVEHVALPNLVLGRRAFPELWLDEAHPAALADAAGALLGAEGSRIARDLAAVRAAVHRPDGRSMVRRAVDGLLEARRGAR